MNLTKRWLAGLLCLLLMFSLAGCDENEVSQSEIFAMDTVMWLTAYGRKRDAGIAAAENVIYTMDNLLDPESTSSATYKINHAGGEPVFVPERIFKMIQTAQEVYIRSDGALDLSIYPLIQRWGFIDRKYHVPTEQEINDALHKRCFDKVSLQTLPNGEYTVSLPEDGMLTFAAIGKGCAASYAIDAMRKAGVTSGIISLGGNVQTLGVKPDGNLWRVGIVDPSNTSGIVGTVDIGEMAVVTSGPYQRNFTDDTGRLYHHILQPDTGYPTMNTLSSVTILCADGTLADCLSTTMYVLGETKAINYWRSYGGFDMVLITNDNRIICTKSLAEVFTLTNTDYSLSYME